MVEQKVRYRLSPSAAVPGVVESLCEARMSIAKRILLGFLGLLLLVAGLGGFAYWRLEYVESRSNWIAAEVLPGMRMSDYIETETREPG